jgi:predicted nucleic acid-binding protein
MAADPTFVDTNLLVYASQKRSAFHVRAFACLQEARGERRALWISRQVLREYLATVTRPQRDQAPLPMAEAIADVEGFEQDFNVAEDGPEVFAELRRLLIRVPIAGKQVHDANIVATMLAHGITRLLTFNAADFRRFGSLIELVTP